jgi:tRNA (cmo5U34)-methyltransferase
LDALSVGDGLSAGNANWKFSGETVDGFDKHVEKSIPLYHEGHDLICDMSDFFVKEHSICFEVGCSTGALTVKLANHHQSKTGTKFIGIDVEADMIRKAEEKLSTSSLTNVEFVTHDAMDVDMVGADLIVCYYTVQFIRPSERQKLINKIYDSLNWGGALLLFEKVRGADARFQDIFSILYSDYKIRMGYSAEEIVSKTRSLKGVLEPFSSQGNVDLLKRAGFIDFNTVQKYLCFEGILAIK